MGRRGYKKAFRDEKKKRTDRHAQSFLGHPRKARIKESREDATLPARPKGVGRKTARPKKGRKRKGKGAGETEKGRLRVKSLSVRHEEKGNSQQPTTGPRHAAPNEISPT